MIGNVPANDIKSSMNIPLYNSGTLSTSVPFLVGKRVTAMTEQTNASKPRIGFIGVGVMGRPMVSNLLKAGFPCTIYDVNPIPVEALVAEGATSANSAAEVAKGSDIFITMVVNDAQFASTLFEPGNAIQALKPGSIVIGMSTMSVRMVRDAAARLNDAGEDN